MTEKMTLPFGDRMIEVDVASEAECEQAQFCVCGSVGYFPDDVHTTCAGCGTAIVHRPYAPKAPPKVCPRCAVDWARAGRA